MPIEGGNMNLMEIDERLDALTSYLKRQGGQAHVPGRSPWSSYKIIDMVEAVTETRKRIGKLNTFSTENQ